VDVSVTLKAPPSAGTYQGYFKLRAPDGIVFGVGVKGDSNFWVKVVVGTTPTLTTTITSTSTSTVAPIADLAVQSSSSSSPTPLTINVSINIINQGTASAGHFKVEWKPIETDPTKCTGDVASLAPGGTTTVNCSYTYPASGPYNSKVEIDTGDEVPESNEGNNTQTIPITVPP
jgi:subtilase family serine protease